mgnify:CR=1 FL=1
MAQHDFILDNAAGGTFRADLNAALAAILSQNSGASAPASPAAHMIWMDTANSLLKIRNAANDAWITVMDLSAASLRVILHAGLLATPGLSFAGDPNTGLYAPGADQVGLVAGGVELLRATATILSFLGTGAIQLTSGTTGQRPGTPAAGMIRYNSTTAAIEGYFGGAWVALGGAAAPSVVTKTSGYTATVAEDLILCNSATAMNQTLYAANASGRKNISYKNIGNEVTTIVPGGGDTIEDEASLLLQPGAGVTLTPDGSNKWYVL